MKPVFVVFFLLLVPLVCANTEYSVVGGNDSDFVLGTGFFNSALTDYDTYTRSITRVGGVPLVADLDGDGVNEIIVMDNNVIRLYQDKTLSIVDSFNTGGSGIPYYLVFDIDGDSLHEVIYSFSETGKIGIVEFNGTHFFNQTAELSPTIYTSGATGGKKGINCRSDGFCVLTSAVYDDYQGLQVNNMTVVAFDENGVIDELSVDSGTSVGYCQPPITVIAVEDYDNDGDQEFIFSALEIIFSGTDKINIYYVSFNTTDLILEQIVSDTMFNIDDGDGSCEVNNPERYITSPLVFDIDGSSSNGLETVVGQHVQSDEFKMYSYNSDGSDLDDYPEILHADGLIMSNVMKFNSHTDTGRVDFCVLGFEFVERELDLLCASEQSSDVPETNEFFYDLGSLYNISMAWSNWERITHSNQHSGVTFEGNNLDEVVCAYGVLALDYSTSPDSLNLIFENPKQNGVVLSVDPERFGLEDLLVMTATNLWFVDDKFTNEPATISEYYVDPCIDNMWKVNTTVEVRITAVDPDGDNVNGSAVLYAGKSYNQTSAWQVVSSGTTIPLFFVANETVGSGILRLRAKDIQNPNDVDVIDLTISVSTFGIEWGSGCITEVDLTAVPTNVSVAPADLSEDEKAEIRGYIMGSGFVPMNYAPIVAMICVIVLSVGSALVMAQHGIRDGMALLYIPLAVGVVSWLFFVFVGMIAGWTVIVAIVLASAGIGYKVYRGHSASGLG